MLSTWTAAGSVFHSWILRDISERRAAEAVTMRLAAIVESSDDAIISKTLDGVIMTWNQGAEKLYGYTAAGATGRSFSILVPPDRTGEMRYIIDSVRRGERVEDYETVRLRKDGTPVEVALTESPIKDADGQVTGISTIARDITARKQIDRLKSEFIATVSHELRTPLTSIRGALGIVAGGVAGPVSPEATVMLDIAYRNSERLVRLINDMLDIEKIEAGTMTFDQQVLDLMLLIEQAIDANRAFARQFGVSYVLTHTDPGLWVNGNSDRLMQVLNNLLANAAKFSSPDGTVTVSVERRGAMVRVAVADQGTGIPAEFRARIFQKFAQADSSDTRQKGGTGLGLSIARAIVEKHGGQIGFTSEAGAGATFYFDLPGVQERMLSPAPDRDGRWCPRMLICANDDSVALRISTLLTLKGWVTDTASDTAQARQLLAQRHYDGLTLDLQLPEQDGLAFICQLRAQEQTRMLPIVVVSIIASERRADLQGGAVELVDWIEKPIDAPRLHDAVQRVLRTRAEQLPRILHIEDDPDVVAVVARILCTGAMLSSANGAREARRKLDEQQVDLVILDLLLVDGWAVELVPLLSRRGIPVVIFSAYDVPRDMTAQVAAALVKSDTSNQSLVETITGILKAGEPAHAHRRAV